MEKVIEVFDVLENIQSILRDRKNDVEEHNIEFIDGGVCIQTFIIKESILNDVLCREVCGSFDVRVMVDVCTINVSVFKLPSQDNMDIYKQKVDILSYLIDKFIKEECSDNEIIFGKFTYVDSCIYVNK